MNTLTLIKGEYNVLTNEELGEKFEMLSSFIKGISSDDADTIFTQKMKQIATLENMSHIFDYSTEIDLRILEISKVFEIDSAEVVEILMTEYL